MLVPNSENWKDTYSLLTRHFTAFVQVVPASMPSLLTLYEHLVSSLLMPTLTYGCVTLATVTNMSWYMSTIF